MILPVKALMKKVYEMDKFIPLSIPNFAGNEKKYVVDAIDSTFVSTVGGYVSKFEENLASFLNVERVVACQSGTSAIHLCLVECGIQPGDTVIVPTLTFIAAVNPVLYQQAIPIFMDCDKSLCMDPLKLSEFCEKECHYQSGKLYFHGSHIKAIVIVHVFGNMADMESIMQIAENYNICVIEDATEALGTHYIDGRYRGRLAGTIGDFGCFSFNGNKIITTGGGGAVVSKRGDWLEHMKYLSTQAKNDPLYYIHDELGYNYRMTNLQAALGVAQLEELPGFIRRKNNNYSIYKDEISKIDGLSLLEFRSNVSSNKWFYSLYVNDEYFLSNIELLDHLKKHQIQTRCIWKLIHRQKMYMNYYAYKIEAAYDYQNHVINLPCSTNLSGEDIKMIVNIINGDNFVLGGGYQVNKGCHSLFGLEVAA